MGNTNEEKILNRCCIKLHEVKKNDQFSSLDDTTYHIAIIGTVLTEA